MPQSLKKCFSWVKHADVAFIVTLSFHLCRNVDFLAYFRSHGVDNTFTLLYGSSVGVVNRYVFAFYQNSVSSRSHQSVLSLYKVHTKCQFNIITDVELVS